MIKDIDEVELEPGDICIGKNYNGICKVKIYKETASSVQLFYWSSISKCWNRKTWVMKGGSFAVFYKIGHEEL